MIPDSQSQRLAESDSGALLAGGLLMLAFGVALAAVGLWAPGESGGPPSQLLLVLGLVGLVAGAVVAAVGVVRLATKVDDIHRMTLAAHVARQREEIRDRRQAGTGRDVSPSP